jgi:hypothetical protein
MRSSFFFLVARYKHAVWRGHAAHIHNPEKRLCGFLSGTGVPAPDRWEKRIAECRHSPAPGLSF